jgi:hypothetical protein
MERSNIETKRALLSPTVITEPTLTPASAAMSFTVVARKPRSRNSLSAADVTFL